ncbi:hypothetical protein D3C79_611230 [compost metagenome]
MGAGMHALQCRIAGEGLQGQQLGAAGATQAPRLLEHATALMALGVGAAGDVVVATRRHEPGEVLFGCVLVHHGLIDGQAQVIFQWQLQQGLVITPHHDEVGPPVDFCALMVMRQLLGAVVAAGDAGNADLADTEGLHLVQVFLQDQPPQGQVLVVHAFQQRLQFMLVADDGLPASGAGQHRFDPQRTLTQQQLRGPAGIGFTEHGVAPEQCIAGLPGKLVSPAWRKAGVGRQRVGDRLGRHVGVADQSAEQVLLAADA